MAAPLLNSRVANVFLRLCEETSLMPARRNAALPPRGKMNPWWLRVGEHLDLRKRFLESFRLKDTITTLDFESITRLGHKHTLDQDTSHYGLLY